MDAQHRLPGSRRHLTFGRDAPVIGVVGVPALHHTGAVVRRQHGESRRVAKLHRVRSHVLANEPEGDGFGRGSRNRAALAKLRHAAVVLPARVAVGTRNALQRLDEFRIYDRSLSAAEVLAQYQYPRSDTDNDGLTLSQEWNLGTDEDDADSDDDGYSDGLEVSLGTDPLDPTSTSARFGLQVHLPFDGADGNLTADASGNNRPATLVGFESNQTTWIPGKIGNAIQFDGANDWGSIPYSLDANFTIALWLKSTDVRGTGNWNQNNTLLTGPNNTYHVCMYIGKFSVWGAASTHVTANKLRQTSNANINTGSWVHLAFSREQDTGNFGNFHTYINGAKDAGPIHRPVKYNTGALLYMGKAITDANYFLNGALDDLRIYDRTLSDAEVKALYDLGQ